ncbi:MAG: hypothetical protein ACOVN2_04525 [Usitatibacteraceae bacterium]
MKAAELIYANIAAHSADGYVAIHEVAKAHERTIAMLCRELAALRGTGYEHTHQLIADAITAAAALAETHAGAEETANALTDALIVFEDTVKEHESESQPEEHRNGLLSFGVAAHNRVSA